VRSIDRTWVNPKSSQNTLIWMSHDLYCFSYMERMLFLMMLWCMLLMIYCAFIWLNHDVGVTWTMHVVSNDVMVLCCCLNSTLMGRESNLMA